MAKTTTAAEPYFSRINRLREKLTAAKVDGLLIQSRVDQYWLTGFTGEDGFVLLTPKQVVLLTDGRFDENADREAPYARKVVRKKRSPEFTAREVKRLRIKRLAFNAGQMSVAEHKALTKLCNGTRLVAIDDPIGPLRLCKDAAEIACTRRAIDIAQQAFLAVKDWLKPGLTEQQVAARLAYEMQSRGATGESFPAIVAFGPNSSLPHAVPTDRPLRANEPLLFDWGAKVDWYASDLTRVIWLGSIPRDLRRIFDTVRDAHDAAIAAIRPGVAAGQIDRVARTVIAKAGYGKQFTHALGHGLGLHVHDGPRVGKGVKTRLEPGMVITIEPGIYLPGVGGIRLEDDVLVTDRGAEVLSSLPIEFS